MSTKPKILTVLLQHDAMDKHDLYRHTCLPVTFVYSVERINESSNFFDHRVAMLF